MIDVSCRHLAFQQRHSNRCHHTRAPHYVGSIPISPHTCDFQSFKHSVYIPAQQDHVSQKQAYTDFRLKVFAEVMKW